MRHVGLWLWFVALQLGVKPLTRIEVWPRGGAKSSTAELGVAYVGTKGTRKFALYVSGTQEQADKHVAAIAAHLERVGTERSLNKYGSSKGWRRNQLRAANGFNVEAIGLDTAARGVKLDEFRPDLIILDDIDDQNDSPATVDKKERAIKSAIVPAGSADCAVLVIQNLIHEGGVVSRLVNGKADFLLNREQPVVEKACDGLTYDRADRGDGLKVYRVTGGTPTWEGQGLSVIESQINEWGLKTFLREAQHEVEGADGYFFDVSKIEVAVALPSSLKGWKFCLACDFAATEGGGDYTAIRLWGKSDKGILYLVKSWRGQWSSDNVMRAVDEAILWSRLVVGTFRLRFKQDPGAAGKKEAESLRRDYAKYSPKVEVDTGPKGVRAKTLAEQVNLGNVRMVSDSWEPDSVEVRSRRWEYAERTGEWNWQTREEYRKFREDEEHENDDQVDADADAVRELESRRTMGAA